MHSTDSMQGLIKPAGRGFEPTDLEGGVPAHGREQDAF